MIPIPLSTYLVCVPDPGCSQHSTPFSMGQGCHTPVNALVSRDAVQRHRRASSRYGMQTLALFTVNLEIAGLCSLHGNLLLQGATCSMDLQRLLAAPIARIGAPIRRHLQSMQLGAPQRSNASRADNLPCTATGGGGGAGDKGPPGGSGGKGEGNGEGDDGDELLSKKQVRTYRSVPP